MKRWLALAGCVLVVATAFIVMLQYQEARVRSGDLIVLSPSEGPYATGRVFVNIKTHTITIKTSVFPVVLWEDADGNIHSRRDMIVGRAYVVANLPASDTEVAFYRHCFAKC